MIITITININILERGKIMKNTWNEKAIKIFHGVRIFFERILLLFAVIVVGSALLSIYSFIHFMNKMATVYKGSPNAVLIGIVVLLSIPLLSFALEKSLSSRLKQR